MKNLILALLFFCLNSSCNHYYYAPADTNLVGLSEKNTVKFVGSVGAVGNGSQNYEGYNYNFQLAGSPLKHLAVQVSHFNLNIQHTDINQSKDIYGNGHINDAAIGSYFFKDALTKSGKAQRYGIDLYAGFGKGKVSNFYEGQAYANLFFNRQFIQSGIYLFRENIGFAFGMRYVWLDYTKGFIYSFVEEEKEQEIKDINQFDPFNLVEFSFKMESRLKYVNFFGSFTIADNPDNQSDVSFNYIKNISSLGVILNLDEIFTGIRDKRRTKKTDTDN